MDKEVLDLIDTALKIGLGALITGFSAYGMVNVKYNLDKKTKKREKSSELVETIAIKIGEAEAQFNEVANEAWAHNSNPRSVPYNEMADKVRVVLTEIDRKLGHAQSLAHLVNADSVVVPIKKNREVIAKFYTTIATGTTYNGVVSTAIVDYQIQLKANYSNIFDGLSDVHKEIYNA